MPTNRELEQEIAELRKMLAQLVGVPMATEPTDPTKRADYIEYGSPAHAIFLGLIPLETMDQAEERTTYTSPRTQKLYCLDDEIAAVRFFQGVDPDKAILLVLRQKVNVFESGPPQVPEHAPPMWQPTPNYAAGL